MVRLEAVDMTTALIVAPFQFQHGTIGSTDYTETDPTIYSVSIPTWYDWKAIRVSNENARISFQFQHGTIGSIKKPMKFMSILLFQFQHGTIGSLQGI